MPQQAESCVANLGTPSSSVPKASNLDMYQQDKMSWPSEQAYFVRILPLQSQDLSGRFFAQDSLGWKNLHCRETTLSRVLYINCVSEGGSREKAQGKRSC